MPSPEVKRGRAGQAGTRHGIWEHIIGGGQREGTIGCPDGRNNRAVDEKTRLDDLSADGRTGRWAKFEPRPEWWEDSNVQYTQKTVATHNNEEGLDISYYRIEMRYMT